MTAKKASESTLSKEEQIGYHKGCANTLTAERAELLRLVGITEALIKAHIQELSKLGVKIEHHEKK